MVFFIYFFVLKIKIDKLKLINEYREYFENNTMLIDIILTLNSNLTTTQL